MSEQPVRIKRFYERATLDQQSDRYVILLDGRVAKTQSRTPLAAPTEGLGRAIAEEWEAQVEFINRETMPLTGMASAAIDGGETGSANWLSEILDYLKSDLVCYRAEAPQALIDRQAAAWDRFIEFMRLEFGAALVTTFGIVAIAQPEASVAAVEKALAPQSAETLFALRIATAISGSAALALALWKRAFPADEVFEASRVDERFQEERWGVDEEASEREARLRAEFLSVDRFLRLL